LYVFADADVKTVITIITTANKERCMHQQITRKYNKQHTHSMKVETLRTRFQPVLILLTTAEHKYKKTTK